jgi:ectoine hydroxylase
LNTELPAAAGAKASEIECTFSDSPRATIGCIQLPTDLTLDSEGPALIARVPGVRLRLQKLQLRESTLDVANYRSCGESISRAAATLIPPGSVDVLGLACTSLALALGPDAVQEELRTGNPTARGTDMASSVFDALKHLDIRKLALLSPYAGELHALLLEGLRGREFDVLSHDNLGLNTDEEITAVSLDSLRQLVVAVDHEDAQAVLIACSALHVCVPDFIDDLERRVGTPVITSQQAFLWKLLRSAGIDDPIAGYGSLFGAENLFVKRDPARAEPGTTAIGIDSYPSRVQEPTVVERQDPVVDSAAERGPLSVDQLERFDRNGALVMRNVFSSSEIEVLCDATRRLRLHYESQSYGELDRTTDMRVITERGGALSSDRSAKPVLKSIWQIHLAPEQAPHMLFAADPIHRAIRDARLVEVARQLTGEHVYIHQSRVNFQRGLNSEGIGGTGFLWHQDFEQWHAEDGMPRMRAVSMAILLERATPQNGALMVVPGSHHRMIQAYGDAREASAYASGALSRGPQLPIEVLTQMIDEHGIEYCIGEPGDVVLFDCNTLHGSHTNISPWGRSMLFAVYNAVSNVPAARPFGVPVPRPEHIGCHDPHLAGVPLPALRQDLSVSPPDCGAGS